METRLSNESGEREYRIAARTRSSALFRPNEALRVTYHLDGVPIRMTLQTRYHRWGFAVPVPGDLWLDARGAADGLKMALALFTNAGRDIASVVALSANAAVAPLEAELGYESTAGITRREYLQRFLPTERMAYTSRFVDVLAVQALVSALAKHPERDRLIRAVSQYSEALSNWRAGSELLAVSHLFMGVEAIKTACWRHAIASAGTTKEDLAKEWGFRNGGRLSREQFLDQEARLRLVFSGDAECHRLAKETSDHFEHGFSSAGALYEPARGALVKTAEYLRMAVLCLLNVSGEHRELLLGPKYKRPRGLPGLDMYISGYLVGEGELAAPNNEYPVCRWEHKLQQVTFDAATERYSFQPSHDFTPQLGEGIAFEPARFEVWDTAYFSPVPDDNQS
jgi:hypothetical protein